ncbi:hypothetical protein HHJ39_00065 [Escherichia coli]|nr:hypothetical protein HHJ39_00065 [Escherichia coli]
MESGNSLAFNTELLQPASRDAGDGGSRISIPRGGHAGAGDFLDTACARRRRDGMPVSRDRTTPADLWVITAGTRSGRGR